MESQVLKAYKTLQKKAVEELAKENFLDVIHVQVGSATCENAAGANEIAEEFLKHIKAAGREADIKLKRVGCTGRCSLEPIVSVFRPKESWVVYQKVKREDVHAIFMEHILGGKPLKQQLLSISEKKMGEFTCPTEIKNISSIQKGLASCPMTHSFFESYGDIPFFSAQCRIALRNLGIIDPENIYEYICQMGFYSLFTILEKNDPVWALNEITKSNLRGRGGAGFPTGLKWSFAIKNEEKERYMICNADEGDPGAFMDRSMLESDPFSIIEGMIIGGHTIGAKRGFFYIRAEYPLAVERVKKAIDKCYQHGLLGKNILGSNFDYDLEIKLGAGAFVCGEETALIHSIEGERGQPRIRPPYPAAKGLWGKPTIINNVETISNLPAIFAFGAKSFATIGTQKSGGTKVFAVSGKVKHTGLVEIPMGRTLKEIVFDICGGVPDNKKLKAIQTGGPAGGCIPAEFLDNKVDYEEFKKLGSIMGSGGLIVLDEDDCMVNVAKFFISFSVNESCGKCTPCREGLTRMLEILERITDGKAVMEDLVKLKRLAHLIQNTSLCGLGKAAPNPVLSTLKYFMPEYEAHIKEKRCPSKSCMGLVRYDIDPEKCVGCTMCARNCPVNAIRGNRKETHVIDQNICIKCGKCLEVCRFSAVKRL